MRVNHTTESGEKVEVTFTTRTVTGATIRYKGKVVAMGDAILNPKDKYDENLGYKIALGRALTQTGVDQGVKRSLVEKIMGKVELKQAKAVYTKFTKSWEESMDRVNMAMKSYFLTGKGIFEVGTPKPQEYLGTGILGEYFKNPPTRPFTPVSYDSETNTYRPLVTVNGGLHTATGRFNESYPAIQTIPIPTTKISVVKPPAFPPEYLEKVEKIRQSLGITEADLENYEPHTR